MPTGRQVKNFTAEYAVLKQQLSRMFIGLVVKTSSAKTKTSSLETKTSDFKTKTSPSRPRAANES